MTNMSAIMTKMTNSTTLKMSLKSKMSNILNLKKKVNLLLGTHQI